MRVLLAVPVGKILCLRRAEDYDALGAVIVCPPHMQHASALPREGFPPSLRAQTVHYQHVCLRGILENQAGS